MAAINPSSSRIIWLKSYTSVHQMHTFLCYYNQNGLQGGLMKGKLLQVFEQRQTRHRADEGISRAVPAAPVEGSCFCTAAARSTTGPFAATDGPR